MSDKAYVNTQLNGLPDTSRLPLRNAFWYVMDNWKVGTGDRASNAQWYRVTCVTHADANTEFSFKHGLPYTPSQVFPVLDLSVVNSVMPTLTVTRAADAERIYLSCPSTSATVTLMVE